jgi:hypothetical protein
MFFTMSPCLIFFTALAFGALFFFGITDVLLPAPAACLGWLWHLAQISNFPGAALVWA